MRERPILMSAPMVRALLNGTKAKRKLYAPRGVSPADPVHLARCSDNTYWAHLTLLPAGESSGEAFEVVASRVDYTHDFWREHGIPQIPAQDHVVGLSVRIARRNAAAQKLAAAAPTEGRDA